MDSYIIEYPNSLRPNSDKLIKLQLKEAFSHWTCTQWMSVPAIYLRRFLNMINLISKIYRKPHLKRKEFLKELKERD